MYRLLSAVLLAVFAFGTTAPVRGADEKEVQAVLDKAIKALGGEDKLASIKAVTWKGKGKITFGDNDNDFTLTSTAQGLDNLRSEFEGEFGGNKITGMTVLAGDKGWRKFGDEVTALDKDGVANEKRNLYLQLVPVTIVPLKGKGFKVESAAADKVDGKATAVLKVTGPDGKDFKLFFDKESGLPVKLVGKVVGFMNDEYTQETTFGGYKDFGGIKKATKVVSTRNGDKFIEQEITAFKPVEKVDAKTFVEPK